jgi:2,5-dihydroxypyridine 5,6-dioxygenase
MASASELLETQAPDACFEEACRTGARMLVRYCARLRARERAYVLADETTLSVARFVQEACHECTSQVESTLIDAPAVHGGRPPASVGRDMLRADVVFCLTRTSLAHTEERFRASCQGTRFLSLPDYSLPLLASRSLQYNFASALSPARRLQQSLDAASVIRISTAAGTNLQCTVSRRRANVCTGICWKRGSLGSPPDAEVNIAPVEGTANGVVVVDGSIPCREIGRLDEPIILQVQRGRIVAIDGSPGAARALADLFACVARPEARCLAEFGIGLNPWAEITGRMLEDEGCAGTIHLGFGSNATIGGRLNVPFHLDFVLRSPDVWCDERLLLHRGSIVRNRRPTAPIDSMTDFSPTLNGEQARDERHTGQP